MNSGGKIVDDMATLLRLFFAYCDETATMGQLLTMTARPETWPKAHSLFQVIRKKTLETERSKDSVLEAQYLFEEICAKTLYNLSGEPAPFDPDSPYWIVPNAISLARAKGISDRVIVEIVA